MPCCAALGPLNAENFFIGDEVGASFGLAVRSFLKIGNWSANKRPQPKKKKLKKVRYRLALLFGKKEVGSHICKVEVGTQIGIMTAEIGTDAYMYEEGGGGGGMEARSGYTTPPETSASPVAAGTAVPTPDLALAAVLGQLGEVSEQLEYTCEVHNSFSKLTWADEFDELGELEEIDASVAAEAPRLS